MDHKESHKRRPWHMKFSPQWWSAIKYLKISSSPDDGIDLKLQDGNRDSRPHQEWIKGVLICA